MTAELKSRTGRRKNDRTEKIKRTSDRKIRVGFSESLAESILGRLGLLIMTVISHDRDFDHLNVRICLHCKPI